MEYQNIINLLDLTPNQPTKFRTKNWVEINDDSPGTHNLNSQIKFKTSMLKSCLCYFSDAYILVSGTITVTALAACGRNNNIQVVLKNCAPFTDFISEINNTQMNNAKDINVVMPVYNLIKYSDELLKNIWKFMATLYR